MGWKNMTQTEYKQVFAAPGEPKFKFQTLLEKYSTKCKSRFSTSPLRIRSFRFLLPYFLEEHDSCSQNFLVCFEKLIFLDNLSCLTFSQNPCNKKNKNKKKYVRIFLTHRVCIARSDVKVPLASVWILLSYSDNSERFCRSWKALARTQWILLAFSNLKEVKENREEEWGKKREAVCQKFLMNYFIIYPEKFIWKSCLVFATSGEYQQSVQVSHLQQLQGVEAVKHPLGQIGDFISIQHTEKSQQRL